MSRVVSNGHCDGAAVGRNSLAKATTAGWDIATFSEVASFYFSGIAKNNSKGMNYMKIKKGENIDLKNLQILYKY